MCTGSTLLKHIPLLKFAMIETKHTGAKPLHPQAVAWVVVVSSFILFCVLCATGTFGAYWFFFESPINMTTQLTVSRGSVTIINPDLTSFVVSDSGNGPKSISSNIIL